MLWLVVIFLALWLPCLVAFLLLEREMAKNISVGYAVVLAVLLLIFAIHGYLWAWWVAYPYALLFLSFSAMAWLPSILVAHRKQPDFAPFIAVAIPWVLIFLVIFGYLLFLFVSAALLLATFWKFRDKRFVLLSTASFAFTVILITSAVGPYVFYDVINQENDIAGRIEITTSMPDIVNASEVRLVPWSIASNYLQRAYAEAASYADTSPTVLAYNTDPTIINGSFYWLNAPQYEAWKWMGGKKVPFFLAVNATGMSIEVMRFNKSMVVSKEHIEWEWRASRYAWKTPGSEWYDIEQIRFDCDDEFNPYFIIYLSEPRVPYGYSVLRRVVVVDAVTGDIKWYEIGKDRLPDWLEVVYPDLYVYKWIKWWASNRFGLYHAYFDKSGIYEPVHSDSKFLVINGTPYWYTPLVQADSHVMAGYMLTNTRTGESVFYNRQAYSYVDYTTAITQLYSYLMSGEMGYRLLSVREGYLYRVTDTREMYVIPLYSGLTLKKVALIDPVNYTSTPIIADTVKDAIAALESMGEGGAETHEVRIKIEGIYIESEKAYIYNNSTVLTVYRENLKWGEHTMEEDWVILNIAASRYTHGEEVWITLRYLGNNVVDVEM